MILCLPPKRRLLKSMPMPGCGPVCSLVPSPWASNTIVGFTVAHWTTDTAQKKLSFLVSAIDFALCVLAFVISLSMHRQYRDADDITPIDGRRQFMARMAMLLSGLSALLVIAGTIAVIMLHPTD